MKIVELKTNVDNRGALTVIEANGVDIPFDIKRCYLLHHLSEPRGGHAHPHTHQIVIAAGGWVRMKLHDGDSEYSFLLESPITGLLINPMTWIEITEFSDNASVVVLASTHYDHKLTIREWNRFLQVKKESK